MRTILIILSLFGTFTSYSQTFAPIGAKWYYSRHYMSSGDQNYYLIEVTKDTLINKKSCTALKHMNDRPNCNAIGETNYVYEEDSIVYVYLNNSFHKLYDFKAKKGDTWSITFPNPRTLDEKDSIKRDITVDSVGIITINSRKLKTLFIGNHKITQQIGDIRYLFDFFSIGDGCDGDYADGLRCYQDANLGNYNTGIAPSCDYKHLAGLDEFPTKYGIEIKLSNDKSLSIKNENDVECSISIQDLSGKKVVEKELKTSQTLDISTLKAGLYIVNLTKNGENIVSQKIMME